MKIDRTRRSWSPREEEVLLSTMKGLIVTGWKADNGFRGGYLSRIMEALKREFPRTDLKTSPHITSKISQWKKSYNSLCGILGRSGVGFNLHNDYKIDYDDDQWEQIIKADKEARNMRFKSWPMWDAWKEIFGKDRAVGTTAADLGEMSKEVCSTGVPFLENRDSEYVASTGAPFGANPQNTKSSPQGLDQTASDNDNETQSAQKKNKKRKVVDRSDILLEMLAKSNEDINSRLDKLTNRIGYEFDVSKARNEVFPILGDIQGLTIGQQLDAARIILEKVQRLDLFMSLPEAFRHTYVVRMLEKHT
ncbi:hypothetical protein SASPL_135612 [Salvia splendens]|uniref:Myb/SANT-like domain-containing protein n=2 Tax=Salvia splendens TaxID=180675 RepID=A0A8X8ZGS6_SALSN|nr:hypothetical protein SASPL_135612 [Salvia splendens]